MPPRFAYWTILVDNQPTSFRASAADDLLPTFNRLKAKNPSAVMMWFQGGKLWPSRLDAQEAMRARGDIGRKHDPKQGDFSRNVEGEGFSPRRDSKPEWKPKSPNARDVARRDWKPKPYSPKAEATESGAKPEWKPKGSFKPEFKSKVDARPEWRAKSFNPKGKSRSEWKPKSSFKPEARGPRSPKPEVRSPIEKPEWKPKGSFVPKPRRPRPEHTSARPERAEWKPRDDKPSDVSRKPTGEAPEFRDRKKWRPGGDHQDPRQKYKDAKKAKWTRFKKTIRARSASAALRRDKSSRPPKKRES